MRPDTDPVAELQARVQNLERRIAVLEGREAPVSAAPPLPASKPERLESRLGVTLINRAGAVTLALGILFFFKYAVDNRWIGAAGRVALGIVAGLLLVGFAERLRKRGQQAFAQGVAACGIAILYTAFYAAFAYYHLFPEWLAFCGMFAASALSFSLPLSAGVHSVRNFNPAVLAPLGTAGAIFTPVFLGRVFPHPCLFLSYLLLVDIAVLAAASRWRLPIASALAFASTAILFVVWTSSSGAAASTGVGVVLLCALFVLFFASSLRAAAPVFLPLNALWTVFSAWMLLDHDHPGWLAVFALGLAAVHLITAVSGKHTQTVRNWLYALGHAFLLTAALRELTLWAVNHSAPVNRASVLSESASVFLAIYAIAGITLGVLRRSRLDRIIGLVLLLAVVGKLYCYDVWQLTEFYRISAFVALGILLLAASYIYSRYREKVEVLWTDPSEFLS